MADEHLEVADWRRRVAVMWQAWREASATDPEGATERFRGDKDRLFAEHPQSPLLPGERASFRGLAYWPYDPAWRMTVTFEPAGERRGGRGGGGIVARRPGPGRGRIAAGILAGRAPAPAASPFGGFAPIALPNSGSETIAFRKIGRVSLQGPLAGHSLPVFWIEGYGGGIFLPFRDGTSGAETYGAGRYLLDTIKSADHGGDAEAGTLLLDFNLAYHPSCAYDPKWSCPLASPESILRLPVQVGERLAERGALTRARHGPRRRVRRCEAQSRPGARVREARCGRGFADHARHHRQHGRRPGSARPSRVTGPGHGHVHAGWPRQRRDGLGPAR